MKTLLTTALVVVVALDASGAQVAPDSSAGPSCQATAGAAAPYARCSLRLEEGMLFAGTRREPIALADEFHPVALSQFVVGDSARRYALKYERDARRRSVMRFAAGAMMLGASVSSLSRAQCNARPDDNRLRCPRAQGVLLGGIGVDLASLFFKWRAENEATRALAWHNRGLDR